MTSRKITPRPGMKGVFSPMHQYPGPDGWQAGTPVEVVAEAPSYFLRIRDEHGREAAVQWWIVDVGSEYQFDGRWLHESDPRVLAELRASLAGLRSEQWAEGVDGHRLSAIASVETRLSRYECAA